MARLPLEPEEESLSSGEPSLDPGCGGPNPPEGGRRLRIKEREGGRNASVGRGTPGSGLEAEARPGARGCGCCRRIPAWGAAGGGGGGGAAGGRCHFAPREAGGENERCRYGAMRWAGGLVCILASGRTGIWGPAGSPGLWRLIWGSWGALHLVIGGAFGVWRCRTQPGWGGVSFRGGAVLRFGGC